MSGRLRKIAPPFVSVSGPRQSRNTDCDATNDMDWLLMGLLIKVEFEIVTWVKAADCTARARFSKNQHALMASDALSSTDTTPVSNAATVLRTTWHLYSVTTLRSLAQMTLPFFRTWSRR